MTFYYPSRIQIDNTPTVIADIHDFAPSGNCVIQGTVGQGKSIFLRYLCIRELRQGKRIPIFLELRRIEKGQSFRSYLYAVLTAYNFDVDDTFFELYASSGKFVLLLDGFDELDSDLVTSVINELELLTQRHTSLQIVVSSRPSSGIERSPHFRVYQLSPLTADDHKPFLEKVVPDQERLKDLLRAIRQSTVQILQLLTTPLMLTLLVIIYKADQTIPNTLSEFYENLFQTLLTRHDRTKPGFTRKRQCALSDRELKTVFEGFCFVTRQKGLLVLNEEQLSESLQVACKVTRTKCEEQGFSEDITKVACLMQEEGFNFHFIHKSVQEFHAASFIRHSHDDLAVKFYSKLVGPEWSKWQQELIFLSQIDKYRFTKHFHAPSILHAFERLGIKPGEHLAEEQVINLLNRNIMHVTVQTPTNPVSTTISLFSMEYALQMFEMSYVSQLFHLTRQETDSSLQVPRLPPPNTNGSSPSQVDIPIGNLVKQAGLVSKAQELVNNGIDKVLTNALQEAKDYIAFEESKGELLTL